MTKKGSAEEQGTATVRTPPTDPLGPNSEIGRKLKQYYEGLVSEEIPDRFASLLAQLEEARPIRKED